MTTIGVGEAPTNAFPGVTLWIDAFGFAIVNAIVVDSPPPGDGFATLTFTLPDVPSSAEGIVASSAVSLTNVVTRSVDPKTTFAPVTNAPPPTCSVVSPAPPSTDIGFSVMSVG